MNPRSWFAIVALLLASLAAGVAAGPGPVFVIPVQSEISAAQFFFLRRALKEAERQDASAVIIHMNTYGGEGEAAIDNMDALLKTHVPTYTYIDSKALSAGALIALATQKIYMSPTGVIGAAAPVLSDGQDLPKTMSDKTISAMSAIARAAAQKAGHNPDLADSFIRKEAELKIGDTVIDRSDSLLTLSAQEATRQFNGKPLLAEGIAASLEEMLHSAGLTGTVHYEKPAGFERLALWVTTLAPLLLIGGILGAYLEFKIPGVILPGALSVICFTLYFAGHYLAGLAGWEVIVCFAIGVTLVLSELLLHPGTILPGVAGLVMMFGALVWAMVDRYPGEPMWPSNDMLVRPMVNLGIAVLVAGMLMYLLARYLPKTSFYHRIVLGASTPRGPGITIPESRLVVSVGMTGKARTTLRPSGKADFNGHVVDVISHGDYLRAGSSLRVIAVEGPRVLVEAGSEE